MAPTENEEPLLEDRALARQRERGDASGRKMEPMIWKKEDRLRPSKKRKGMVS